MSTDYVYALHDFIPENEDEVSFKAGERIQVLERDDAYGDGWWQGRNLEGKVGLFPQSYTTSVPPSPPPAHNKEGSKTTLQPLAEESDTESTVADRSHHVSLGSAVGGAPKPPEIQINGQDETMEATLTDVQKAIEQLGRGRSRLDSVHSANSYSFASSSRGESPPRTLHTDSDFSASDADEEVEIPKSAQAGMSPSQGGFSHKGARRRLAEKARRAVEEAEKLDLLTNSMMERRLAPPIEVEVSDESESEEEEDEVTKRVSKIQEETEEEEELEMPPKQDEEEVKTATLASFPREPTPIKAPTPEPVETPAPPPFPVPEPAEAPPMATFPSTPPIITTSPSAPPSITTSPEPKSEIDPDSHLSSSPSTWTVNQVVSWLKNKGFGADVCEKFIEQEITGDVLLALDINLLKSEIGIMAFGKRMRIANAITDLRRPPSIQYSDHQFLSHYPAEPASPGVLSSPAYTQQTHSRTQSLVPSHHSYPGSTMTNGQLVANGLMSPESAPHTGDLPASPREARFSDNSRLRTSAQLVLSPSDSNLTATASITAASTNGGKTEGERPLDPREVEAEERAAMSESEVIPSSYSVRRRLFGRSHDSTASKESKRSSSQGLGTAPSSPLPETTFKDEKEKEKEEKEKDKEAGAVPRHRRAKKSLDATHKSSDRLSIFGTSFSSSLGKGRKPPPRYSVLNDDTIVQEKSSSSSFHLPKLGGRKSSGRPSTSDGTKTSPKGFGVTSPKEMAKTKESLRDFSTSSSKDSPQLLRKRTSSHPGPNSPTTADTKGTPAPGIAALKPGQSVLNQIGEPDHSGYMRKKGERYNSWKMRYFVLKGPHLYILRNNSSSETKIKGYVNIIGYKVTVDENVNPGRYGFRIEHESDKTHFFSSEEKNVIRDWMKAIMKATIGRDYTKPVISSCNIPTIPLMVAQAMNPAPRPPSPTARDATQKALRRENPNQLSSRDARVLMGLPEKGDERARVDSFFTNETVDSTTTTMVETPKSPIPPRPSREGRRVSSQHSINVPIDDTLIEWANSHLPTSLQITDTSGSICGGLTLLRLAESIKGTPSSPPVPDSAFPTDPTDDKLDGLFRLFDFLLDNDVKMGSVSINDIRQGKRDKVVQLLKALRAWEEKRRVIAQSIGKGSVQAGGFMAPVMGMPWTGAQV